VVAGVSVARYAYGVLALALVCGSLGVAAVALRRRYFPEWDGALARLTEAVIGLALLTAILEVLGTIGWFRLGTIVAVCAASAAGVLRAVGWPRGGHPRGARAGASWQSHLLVGAPLIAAAAVLAEWAAPTLESYDVGIRPFDSLWYHLPWAASFAQTGHIASLRFTDVEYLTAFYPAGAELIHGLGIVLLGRDTLSPVLNLLWLGLTLLAAYCIGRRRGLGALTMTGAALALGTRMVVFSQAGSAANDVVGVFFLLAAVAMLMNAADAPAPFLLAAIAAGLAVSVKLSLLAPVLALTLSVIVSRRGRQAARWIGCLLLAGGYWYVRNLVTVGNPLPWTSLGVLPTPAAPLQQHTAYSVVHYLGGSHLWKGVFEPGLASGLGPWWPVILMAVIVGPILCLLAGSSRELRVAAFTALASTLAYVLTPESAAGPAGHPLGFAFNLRYGAPALTLSLALAPLAPVLSGGRRRLATEAGLIVVLAATLAQARLWPSAHVGGALAVAAVVALLVAAVRSRPRRVLLLAGAGTLALAAAALGYPLQRHYLHGRYAYEPGVSSLSRVWARFRAIHHSRVAVVGTFGGFFSYPLFGLDDSNRVRYVARRGAHGSFTPIESCAAWRSALNAGSFRYVVTTPARDPWHPRTLSPSPEGAWTASDPAAHLIYGYHALGQPISVFELVGELNPTACPG
jgi:hypothetical protein